MIGVGGIDHVQQQVGIGRLLQRGLKGVDQAVRQVADEAHGVRQRHRAPGPLPIAQVQLARGGVERGKQLVGRIRARLDQRVEQRRLAGVGVADQRNVERALALALAALRLALALDLGEALLGALDRFADHAAVQFDLRLAGAAAAADAALLALQVAPAAHQARAEVLQARQFDLQLALVAAGALGEDFKNQQRAVVDRQADGALQIALLHRAEGLVEQHLLRALGLGQQADFIRLAAADEQRRIGRLALAGDARDRLHAGGLRQQAQLFQLAVEMGGAQVHADQDGSGTFRVGGGGQWGDDSLMCRAR